MRKGVQNGSARKSSVNYQRQKKVDVKRHQLFLYLYIIKCILKEQFLGVPKSEKPECTKRTRGFRRQGQRQKCPLKSFYTYPKNDNRIPAATAEPITPATLGPIACINRKLEGFAS